MCILVEDSAHTTIGVDIGEDEEAFNRLFIRDVGSNEDVLTPGGGEPEGVPIEEKPVGIFTPSDFHHNSLVEVKVLRIGLEPISIG